MCEVLSCIYPKKKGSGRVGEGSGAMLLHGAPKTFGATVLLVGVGRGKPLKVTFSGAKFGKFAIFINSFRISLDSCYLAAAIGLLFNEGGEVAEVVGAAIFIPAGINAGEARGVINKAL